VKKLWTIFKRFLDCEKGQATTEYILLLTVAVSLFLVFKKILGPILMRINEAAVASVSNRLSNGLHNFRVGH
jgi:Flp pilus assembly pilin Flp